MPIIRTDLRDTRERARELRFETVDAITQTNVQKAIEQLLALGIAPTPTTVTSTPYTLLSTDVVLEINVQDCVIEPGSAANRNKLPVIIHDITGTASTHPHTFDATVETIVGPQLSSDYGTVAYYPSGANWRFRQ